MNNLPDPATHSAEAATKDANPDEGRSEGLLQAIEHGLEEIKTQPADVLFVDVLKIDLPYIIMLSMAVLGVGLITFTGEPVAYYWEMLAPVYCAICIFVGWRHTTTGKERMRLIWTQVLHWAAFLATMFLMYSGAVRSLVDVNASGLSLMLLLALATFVAGVHAAAWQISAVGLILALSVPAVAFIQQSSLFIFVALIGVVFVGASLYFTTHAKRREAQGEA